MFTLRLLAAPSLFLLCCAQAIGIAAFADLGDVPYYLCAVLCGLYHALAQPLESSFHQQLKAARAIGGGAAAVPSEAVVQVGARWLLWPLMAVVQLQCSGSWPLVVMVAVSCQGLLVLHLVVSSSPVCHDDTTPKPWLLLLLPCAVHPVSNQQSKMDSFLLALMVLVAPATCYLAIHASVLSHWMHFWSLIILGSAPLLYICALPQGLWWVPMPPRLITGLSRLLMVLGAFGLLAGAEACACVLLSAHTHHGCWGNDCTGQHAMPWQNAAATLQPSQH